MPHYPHIAMQLSALSELVDCLDRSQFVFAVPCDIYLRMHRIDGHQTVTGVSHTLSVCGGRPDY